jgi:hypothetical protein
VDPKNAIDISELKKGDLFYFARDVVEPGFDCAKHMYRFDGNNANSTVAFSLVDQSGAETLMPRRKFDQTFLVVKITK